LQAANARSALCRYFLEESEARLMDRNGRRRPGVADQNFKIASR
jgi:hypothetical protein